MKNYAERAASAKKEQKYERTKKKRKTSSSEILVEKVRELEKAKNEKPSETNYTAADNTAKILGES